MGVHVPLKAC
jgi:ATP-dependent DNA helicase PIF1